jgi:acetylornithine deacetylase/succinyl-diaminopimelate desuccinylase-like protein
MSDQDAFPSNVVDLLQQLVRIPSVNPDGDPGIPHSDTGEQACAQYVARFLEACGAAVTLDEIEPGRPNVIGRFPNNNPSPGKAILFGPHLDTVSVAGMTIDPFAAELRDNKIHGRGASDTKGSMAAMLWALYQMRDRIPSLNTPVAFAGFMGEETGQFGSRHFAIHYADEFAFALVGEPTQCNIVHTHKGCLWVELTTHGKAVHGSTPELGENAVTKMASLIGDLDTAFREQLAAYSDPTLGPSTLNIGLINGGSRANIVPDHAQATLDLRLTPSLPPDQALLLLEQFAHQRDPSLTLKPLLQCAPLATDPSHPIIQKLLSTPKIRGEAASAPGLRPAPWFCDAAILANAGIPSIAIGPGSINQAHTKDEFLAVDDLEETAAFFQSFLESLS